MPPSVVLSIIVLLLIAFVGIIAVSSGFGYWFRRSHDPFPIELIGRALLYGVVPILAIIDLFKGRLSGRYLGVLPIFCFAALLFRFFVDQLSAPLSVRAHVAPLVMPAFALGIVLVAMGFSLGFSKKVTAYFQTPKDEPEPRFDLRGLLSDVFRSDDLHCSNIRGAVTRFK